MLQQVVKRLDERIKNNLLCENEVSVDTKVKRPHTYGPIVDSLSSGTQYEKINFSNLDISIFTPDNVVTISEGSTDTKVLLIENIIEFKNDFFLVGKLFCGIVIFLSILSRQVLLGQEWFQIFLVRSHIIQSTRLSINV